MKYLEVVYEKINAQRYRLNSNSTTNRLNSFCCCCCCYISFQWYSVKSYVTSLNSSNYELLQTYDNIEYITIIRLGTLSHCIDDSDCSNHKCTGNLRQSFCHKNKLFSFDVSTCDCRGKLISVNKNIFFQDNYSVYLCFPFITGHFIN